ncbi:uncharacterized protein EV420DRAFT_1566867 [Desarmillaria tabescens]|uniref:Secreted protein n=1 Tax=Armillaria tabescens TaxID=1929756 RepID=A0AA39JV54_ARMTA|nr:uncharacterized protein EV420DRAFT_1566867 [Desarmillaria tabescens]KAK0448455.1 hypothetical protein EV420DRAFT_1566867 [Desarmillaria tabescens]
MVVRRRVAVFGSCLALKLLSLPRPAAVGMFRVSSPANTQDKAEQAPGKSQSADNHTRTYTQGIDVWYSYFYLSSSQLVSSRLPESAIQLSDLVYFVRDFGASD